MPLHTQLRTWLVGKPLDPLSKETRQSIALVAFFAWVGGEGEIGVLFGGGLPPIVWVLATVLIWRETPQERMQRITAMGTDSVSCPVCGYNLTGLREARCPECGSSFTLDQLLSGQPQRDKARLETVVE